MTKAGGPITSHPHLVLVHDTPAWRETDTWPIPAPADALQITWRGRPVTVLEYRMSHAGRTAVIDPGPDFLRRPVVMLADLEVRA